MEAFQTVLQAYVVQDSPPYNRVLTTHARYTLSLVFKASWLLFHNLLPSFDKTAAALAYTLVHLCVDGQIACHSRTKVSEVVDDPPNTSLLMLIDGGAGKFWPTMLVFLMLILNCAKLGYG